MKKTFLFASLLAVVAMFAVSCDKEKKNGGGGIDAPKALFDYTIDGMDVTFQNMSKDAESYVWDFGDGSATVTDQDPKHTYKDYGTYTVTLTAKNASGENTYSDQIPLEKQAVEMKVDGDFSDWAAVPAELLAEAATDENAATDALNVIKFCTDANYIYYYAEFSGEEELVEYIAFMMDMDNDPLTGYSIWFWENAGAECMVLGGLSEGYENAAIYTFPEGQGQDEWGWDDTGTTGAIAVSEIVTLENGHKAIEGSITRALLPNVTPTALNIGVYVSDPDWNEVGNLPQVTIGEEGEQILTTMLSVKLN